MRTNGWTDSKLLVWGLLRTVSALAATDSRLGAGRGGSGSSSLEQHLRQQTPPGSSSSPSLPVLTLRLARRQDVPSIQRCNLATLPENYNQQFYANHLREWPDLAFVAVDANAASSSSSGSAFSSFPAGAHNAEEKVVAYVLGKVEERPVHTASAEELLEGWHDRASFLQDWRHREPQPPRLQQPPGYPTTERLGHVTSLAVLEPYRRRGLAAELMRQLHYHLAASYHVDSVGLHVRKSNVAAERLYASFGYRAADCIPGYYQDGEDAYFMKKKLPVYRPQSGASASSSQSSSSLFGSVLRPRRGVWETGPEDLRLPRMVGGGAAQSRSRASGRHPPGDERAAPELLTGTM